MTQPAPIQPAPVPMIVNVAHVRLGAAHLVRVAVSSQEGIRYLFLDPETAEKVAEDIAQAARTAKTGLQVVGQIQMPNGGPHA